MNRASSALLVAAALLAGRSLPAQVINFDDLPASSAFGTSLPDPYSGFRWATGAHALAYITAPSIGSSCHSLGNCAFNSQGFATRLVRADGSPFVLEDFWIHDWHAGPGVGAATSATSLNVRGLVGSTVVFDDYFALGGLYQHAFVSSIAVDRIEFITHGGSDFASGDGGYFLMDDIRSRAAVPEPRSILLVGTGLILLGLGVRRGSLQARSRASAPRATNPS